MSLSLSFNDSSCPMIDPKHLRNLACQKAKSIPVEIPPNVTPEHIIQELQIHQIELEMHNEKLERSQRLESIGTLAGGIAHDLNNVLTPIVMGADLIESSHLDSTEREILETISGNARRGADMIRQLLD